MPRLLVMTFLLAGLTAGAALAASRATVSVRSTSLGRVLVAANGRTLYVYRADIGRKSACYGQCASFWPPLLATSRPVAGAGVKASLLGTTTRKDGSRQVTYAGHPLYLFAEDTKPGQVKGELVQHAWWAVSPAGTRVQPKASSATPPATTTGSSGGGYGYP